MEDPEEDAHYSPCSPLLSPRIREGIMKNDHTENHTCEQCDTQRAGRQHSWEQNYPTIGLQLPPSGCHSTGGRRGRAQGVPQEHTHRCPAEMLPPAALPGGSPDSWVRVTSITSMTEFLNICKIMPSTKLTESPPVHQNRLHNEINRHVFPKETIISTFYTKLFFLIL